MITGGIACQSATNTRSKANERSMAKANAVNGKRKKLRDPIPERFESVEAAADFWDTHSLADYEDEFREVKDVIIDLPSRRLNLEEELAAKINRVARRRGVSVDTLVHLWLQQKLSEAQKREQRHASSRTAMAAR